ncbi:MAG: putative LPS assembly protein LptD [Bacteroidia bacterium]|nr:putative LPS assembly protein LptD [Bacteroidia bacterium]
MLHVKHILRHYKLIGFFLKNTIFVTVVLFSGYSALFAQNVADSVATSNALSGDSTGVQPSDPRQIYLDSLEAASDLKAEVTYKAADSIVFDVDQGILFLYENAELNYDEIGLKAKEVRVDIDKQTLYANGTTDSLGTYLGAPEFTQSGETYMSRAISYNFKTQKGRVVEGRMVESEGFVLAEVAKYHPDGTFHGQNGKYTTCDAEDPHYFIRSRKLKMLPDDKLISGPLNLVIAGFPIPVVVPFGFVPNKKGQKNGLILPQYGEAQDRGFFLRNMGYYWGINDNFDLRLEGDIYTRGGWRLGASTTYNKRYKFSGRMGFQYGVTRFNEKTDPDFQRTAAWSVNWSHNQPIDPTARISASVNISSSNRFQREISYNQNDFFTNNLNSSVNFQKNFNNLPISFNLGVRHQQDLNKETMSLQFPELNFNMNRQTPFRGISNKNLKWLAQLGINYNMQARNSLETIPDTLIDDILLHPGDSLDYVVIEGGDSILTKRLGSSFYSNGMRHNASTSTTLKLFNYLNISPNFSYAEYWYTETIQKTWDSEQQKIVETPVAGFARAYDFNTSLGATTNFYGIYVLPKTKREIAFRQRFSPSVSYNLKPDFSEAKWGFFDEVQSDTTGTKTQVYSLFEDGIYGGPSRGESQSFSFNLSSVLEMKYRKKESFEEDFDEKEDKFARINVLDNIGIGTSYNFAADSFQLAPFSFRARTSLFNNKVDLNGSMTMDPYVFAPDNVPVPIKPPTARRQDRLMIQETGELGRITRAQISLSTSFSSKKQGAQKNRSEEFDEVEFREISNNLYQYVDFDIPWTLRFRYNLSYTKPDLNAARITQTMNFDGDVNFTPKWKIGYSSGFDIENLEFTNTRVTIFRDLHCWEMSFSWIPFGAQKSYSLTINVRSSTLKDLRLSKNNYWQDRFRGL